MRVVLYSALLAVLLAACAGSPAGSGDAAADAALDVSPAGLPDGLAPDADDTDGSEDVRSEVTDLSDVIDAPTADVGDTAVADGGVATDADGGAAVNASDDVEDISADADASKDSVEPNTDWTGGWPGAYEYSGPGYPTTLPPFSAQESITGLGGFYKCDQDVPIPSGSDVPGPCVVVSHYSNGKPSAYLKRGYDCSLRLAVEDAYQFGDQEPLSRTEFDWNDAGQLTREELWAIAAEPYHWLQQWAYYDDGRVSEYHNVLSDEEAHVFYYYTFDEAGLLSEEIHEATVKAFSPWEKEWKEETYAEHRIWKYDEEGKPIWYQRAFSSVGGPITAVAHTVEWQYDEQGRVEYETTYSADFVQVEHHSYLSFGDGLIERIEVAVDGDELLPQYEYIYDSKGQVSVLRFLKPGWPLAQCDYGTCWSSADSVLGRSYNEAGVKALERSWANDFTYFDDIPESIWIAEFDEHARRSRSGRWTIGDWVEWLQEPPDTYSAEAGTSYHYECWDDGTAHESAWTP